MARRGLFRRLASDRRGNIALLGAGLGGIVCLVAALAVDVGSIAVNARRLQGAADLAAMDAAVNLATATQSAGRTATANYNRPFGIAVSTGQYRPDASVAPSARFTTSAASPNAVRVTLDTESPLYFGGLLLRRDSVSLRRSAIAAARNEPVAAFSIGSRLASLDGGVANQLLTGLTGSSVSLTVMDYRALADARVNVLEFSDALAADIHLTAGDYNGLLKRSISTGDALKVLETLLGPQTSSALSRLSTAASRRTLRIADLIGVEPGGEDVLMNGLNAEVSALDLVMAMLEIGAGDRQIALDFGVQTGLAALTADLGIGERPNATSWFTITRSGQPVIRTTQARLYVRAKTAQKLSGLAQVEVPLLVELAASEARLQAVECGRNPSVTLGVRPGAARATIGSVDPTKIKDFKTPLPSTPATILSVAGLASIRAEADVEVADLNFKPVKFSTADIAARKTRSVQTTQIATSSLTSLFQNLKIDVQALGLGIGLGGLSQAAGALLTPIGPVLDSVINPLFDLLGLHFGEADVTVNGVSCETGRVRLVG